MSKKVNRNTLFVLQYVLLFRVSNHLNQKRLVFDSRSSGGLENVK